MIAVVRASILADSRLPARSYTVPAVQYPAHRLVFYTTLYSSNTQPQPATRKT